MNEAHHSVEAEPINAREEVVMSAILEFMQAEGTEEEKAIALQLLRERFASSGDELASTIDIAAKLGVDANALWTKINDRMKEREAEVESSDTATPGEEEVRESWFN